MRKPTVKFLNTPFRSLHFLSNSNNILSIFRFKNITSNLTMNNYLMPTGVHAIPQHQLDLRSESEIDHDLLNPSPITNNKNVWFFWHSGFLNMHPYTQRNVRAWHRRLSKLGWTIRVIDRQPNSPLNIANFLDVSDPRTFPQSFIDGRIGGDFAPQHTSDLARFPLLLKYGGVYADVGLMQIGDLDRLWETTIGDPAAPWEVLSYNMGSPDDRALTNYFIASKRNNPLFERCHRLLLAIWAENGGRVDTEGAHKSSLLKELPLIGEGMHSFTENGRYYGPDETARILTDYIIQGQVITMVMSLVDEEGDWNGPRYCAEHIYAIDYMEGSQLINEFTEWKGLQAFELMSLSLPKEGEAEAEDQRQARTIVEACLQRSFGFKLAHGLIIRVYGDTLGSLWRKHTGSDNVRGTYAHWLRQGMIYWTQDGLPPRQEFKEIAPLKRGPLLREA